MKATTNSMLCRAGLALFCFFTAPTWADNKAAAKGNALPPEPETPAVDQAQVDAAIAKGAEWLRARVKEGLPPITALEPIHKGETHEELVLYTLLHAGVDRRDPDLVKLVHSIRANPLSHTYGTALRAMAFGMYDPVKLRADIVQCAQFLVDNQGHNGEWGYSNPVPLDPLPQVMITAASKPPPPRYYITTGPQSEQGTLPAPGTPGAAAPAKSADAARRWPDGTPMDKTGGTDLKREPPRSQIARRRWGEPNDNSNTQYAVLGLRACMAAGIYPPADCLLTAEKWLTGDQQKDGGWGYNPRYGPTPYGSMTAGGVSSLAVCVRAAHNQPPVKDERVQRGIQWLTSHLDFGRNPEAGRWQYYWIYAVERAGALAETEWFGDKPWYHLGATYLLGSQSPEGTWGRDGDTCGSNRITDTCWAILFLRRATKQIAQKKVIFTQ